MEVGPPTGRNTQSPLAVCRCSRTGGDPIVFRCPPYLQFGLSEETGDNWAFTGAAGAAMRALRRVASGLGLRRNAQAWNAGTAGCLNRGGRASESIPRSYEGFWYVLDGFARLLGCVLPTPGPRLLRGFRHGFRHG